VSAKNIMQDTVELSGSVRKINDDTRLLVREKMEQAVANVCEMYGATYDFNFQFGYAAVVNDDGMTDKVRQIATEKFGDKVFDFPLVMGGEDFSSFSRLVPSTYAIIGVRNPVKDREDPHHHPKFGMDEDGFIDGVKKMVFVALDMKE